MPDMNGVGLIICDFPANAAPFDAFAGRGAGWWRCPRCGEFGRHGFASVFAPSDSESAAVHPGATAEIDAATLACTLTALLGRPITAIEVMADARAWRTHLLRWCCEGQVALLNQLKAAAGDPARRAALMQRFLNEPDLIGARFQAAVWSILAGYVQISVAAGREDLRDRPYLPPDEAAPLMTDEGRERARADMLEISVLVYALGLCARADHRWTTPLPEVLARPKLLIPATLAAFGEKIAEAFGPCMVHYDRAHYDGCRAIAAYEGVHAAQYDGLPFPNPRVVQWSEAYVAYQLMLTQAQREDPAEHVPLAFARRTLSFDQVLAAVLKLASEPAEDGRTALSVAGLSVLRVFDESSARAALPLRFADDALTTLLKVIAEVEIDQLHGVCREYLHGVTTPHDLMRIAEAGAARLLAAGRADELILLLCDAVRLLHQMGEVKMTPATLDGARAALGEAWESLRVETRAAFLTEYGNAQRYAGQSAAALATYDACRALIGDDLRDADVRVNERNRAIALRESNHLSEAMRILDALAAVTTSEEWLQVQNSRLSVLSIQRDETVMRRTVDQLVARVPVDGWALPTRRQIGLGIAGQLDARDTAKDRATAEAIVRAIHASASRDDDLLCRGIAALMLRDGAADDAQRADYDQDVEVLVAYYDDIDLLQYPTASLILSKLLTLPIARASQADVLDFARAYLARWSDLSTPLHASARYHLARYGGGEADAAADDALEGLDQVIRLAAVLDPQADPHHALAPLQPIVDWAAHHVGEAGDAPTSGTEATMQRALGDLQSSLVLSQRICQRSGAGFDDIDSLCDRLDEAVLAGWLSDDTVIVQPVERGRGLTFIVTQREGAALTSRVVDFPLPTAVWHEVARRLHFRLPFAMMRPAPGALSTVRGWPELDAALYGLLVSLGRPRVIWSSGRLPTAPVTLAAPAGQSITFAPSLLAYAGLQHAARAAGVRPGWRPRSVFDAAVWRIGDLPESIDAITAASRRWHASCDAHAIAWRGATGAEATGPAILAGLAASDAARIACHGRVSEHTAELLVAHDGNLPPSKTLPRHPEALVRHLLDWGALATLRHAPKVVVSGACDSGQAIFSEARERLGIERAMLLAGTLVYVAPQWPVLMNDVQPLSATLFDAWLNEPSATLAELVTRLADARERDGMPRWIARSLSVFGLATL
jgi:hypothetical protein